ncbi:hypothetical protein ACG04R_02555 [Roseateles sp. BYS78W]|uniref:Uncharacterized protein n=1 Tax=Pelomonas candidula TaxID=3299025 RepID=A0ABW7H6K3_9BURK
MTLDITLASPKVEHLFPADEVMRSASAATDGRGSSDRLAP